jgi:hypothetical protein
VTSHRVAGPLYQLPNALVPVLSFHELRAKIRA